MAIPAYTLYMYNKTNVTNMTMTSSFDGGPTLEEYNQRQLEQQLAAVVYTGLLMAVGTPGNILVLYVYFCKWHRSTSRMFILFLTALDLVNCVTTLPMEIFIMRYPLMLDLPWLCKVSRFLTYTMNSSSAAVLVGIAVDRYRRICRPHGNQFSARASKYICIGSILLALGLSWPALVMYGTRTIPLGPVVGKACLLENRFDTSPYPYIFFIVMTVSTLIIFTTLSVLYYFVGLQVYKHGAFRKKRQERLRHPLVEKSSTKSNSANLLHVTPTVDVTENDGDSANKQTKENGSISGNNCSRSPASTEQTDEGIVIDCNWSPPAKANNDTCSAIYNNPNNALHTDTYYIGTRDFGTQSENIELTNINESENSTNENNPKTTKWKIMKRKKERLRRNSSSKATAQCIHVRIRVGKSTLMLFLITIAYIVSFLPFYVIAIMRQTYKDFVSQLDDVGYMVYHVFLRSYLLSSAVNPIIYSFCNSQFRSFCFGLCKKGAQ